MQQHKKKAFIIHPIKVLKTTEHKAYIVHLLTVIHIKHMHTHNHTHTHMHRYSLSHPITDYKTHFYVRVKCLTSGNWLKIPMMDFL